MQCRLHLLWFEHASMTPQTTYEVIAWDVLGDGA